MGKREDGFTLIELIIVIAILAIIAAVAVPNIIFAINDARIATDLSNAKVIADSIQIVITKDNDIFRTDFTDVEFESVVTGQPAAVEALIEAAAIEIQAVPLIKYGALAGTNFNVSIGSATGIIVKAGTTEIYPTPAGDWAK